MSTLNDAVAELRHAPGQIQPALHSALSFIDSIIRIILLFILALVFNSDIARGQQASNSPSKANPGPTPIPLAEVPSQAQSALDSLQDIEADVSRDQSSADSIARNVRDLKDEIDARIGDDRRLLTGSPPLDVLYMLKLAWQGFDVRLLVSARQLTAHATSLEDRLGRLDKLTKAWQATLQAAKQPGTPPPVLERVQSVVDSAERARQTTESAQAHVLALQGRVSEEQAQYLSWIVTAYLLTATAVTPLYGKLADIRGRRPVIFGAIGIFVAGSIISALARSMLLLVIGRAIQGIRGGGLGALSMTVIGDVVAPRERGQALK